MVFCVNPRYSVQILRQNSVHISGLYTLPYFTFHIYTLYYGFPISGRIISSYIGKLSHSLETIRMGYSLALGALPRRFVSGKLDCVLAGLFKASKIDEKCMGMAEARRDAVKAVVRWVKYIKQAPSVKASIYILDILAFTRSLTG